MVRFQVLPLVQLVVPWLTPFLYTVIVAVETVDPLSLVQLPPTETLVPAPMPELTVGAAVQGSPAPGPEELMSFSEKLAVFFATYSHASVVFGNCVSSIPYISDRVP